MSKVLMHSLGRSKAPVLRKIRVGDLALGSKDRSAINDVLYSNQISPGPKVCSFEKKFAGYHDSHYGVMTNSGTDALRIALLTLKEVCHWKDGDIVLAPAVTFVATVNVILQCGLRPYLIDVGMYDYNMNPDNLERRLSTMDDISRIKGMIVVHLAGQPAPMQRLMELATKYRLRVIEDSCETMGVLHKGKSVGAWGDIGCFSFYVAHLLTTGVGGMAIGSNQEYEMILRSYMNHGRDFHFIPGVTKSHLSKELLQARFRFDRIGYSSRPTEFEAALGLTQLPNLPVIIHQRRENAKRLISALQNLPLVLPMERNPYEHSYMFFPVAIPEKSKVNKWDLCLYLESHGIETRELLPLTNQPCYEGLWPDDDYYVAKWLNEKAFYVGCHQGLGDEDMDYIAEAFKRFYRLKA